jgi:hypothetical protein
MVDETVSFYVIGGRYLVPGSHILRSIQKSTYNVDGE